MGVAEGLKYTIQNHFDLTVKLDFVIDVDKVELNQSFTAININCS